MRSMTHIPILTECRHLQLFSFFMQIIGFLPDNRKKNARIRINSYDSWWLEDKKSRHSGGQVSMVAQDVGHRRRFTPIIADGGPSTGPPSAQVFINSST